MLLVSTRKGLFVAEPQGDSFRVTRGAFIGDNVSLAMVDSRDGGWYAALDHGHFGVKLHRSDDRGVTWTEITTPGSRDAPSPHQLEPGPRWGETDVHGRVTFRGIRAGEVLVRVLASRSGRSGLESTLAENRVTIGAGE